MSSITWTTIKNAIHAWFVAGSGLDGSRVIFAKNNPPRPDGTGAYIVLRLFGSQSIGRDWTVYDNHPTPVDGAELIAKTKGTRRLVINATCFPPATETDSTSAWALLNDVVAELGVPARSYALNAAGIGLLRCEPITPLDGAVGSTKFEPRATMPFAFLVPSEVTSTETFIEFLNVDVEVPDNPAQDFSFTIDLEPE